MKNIEYMISEARKASATLLGVGPDRIAAILEKISVRLTEKSGYILSENNRDLACMDENNPDYDRLKLNRKRIEGIAGDMASVARLPEPYGKVISDVTRPNGMRIRKISVPFGVIGVIYEARPNVTADVFSLCFRSGSACVLKGDMKPQIRRKP